MSARDTSETFGQLLHGTARAWRQKLDQRLKPMGLSQAKWRTMGITGKTRLMIDA